MAKYKDADRLMAILENRCDEADNVEAWLAYAIACEDVRDLPSADVVEVVRCKDCKHRYVGGYTTLYYVCDFMNAELKDEGYCSYGERKE